MLLDSWWLNPNETDKADARSFSSSPSLENFDGQTLEMFLNEMWESITKYY